MVFLKLYFKEYVLILFIFSGCTQHASNASKIKNYIHNKYINKEVDYKHLDKFSKVLSSKENNALKNKLLGNEISTVYIFLKNNIIYIKIRFFDLNVAKTIKKAMKKFPYAKGIIVDIRNNTGGLLDEAIKVSNLFLDDGLIIEVRGRMYTSYFRATKHTTITHRPLIILVNKNTASASEIFAGSMQINNRAILIGEQTYGKGTIQDIIALNNKESLKLTVERYYLKGKKNINNIGISPDLVFEKGKLNLKTNKPKLVKIYHDLVDNHIIQFTNKVDNNLLLASTILVNVKRH